MANQIITFEPAALTELGRRLGYYRLNQNLTQQDLAREAGVGVNTVYRIEQGHSIQLSNLIRLMRVLGLTDNFNQLIPVLPFSPVQQAKLGKEKRRRASAPREKIKRPGDWKWGDES